MVYTGEACAPSVTVVDGETTLVQDVDYTVTCENNINAGTASVLVTGIGQYTATAEKTFQIIPALT